MKKSMFLQKPVRYINVLNTQIEELQNEGWNVESYQTIAGIPSQVQSNQDPLIVVHLTKIEVQQKNYLT